MTLRSGPGTVTPSSPLWLEPFPAAPLQPLPPARPTYLLGSHSAVPSWPQFSLFRLTAHILMPVTVGRRDTDAMPTYVIHSLTVSNHSHLQQCVCVSVCTDSCSGQHSTSGAINLCVETRVPVTVTWGSLVRPADQQAPAAYLSAGDHRQARTANLAFYLGCKDSNSCLQVCPAKVLYKLSCFLAYPSHSFYKRYIYLVLCI